MIILPRQDRDKHKGKLVKRSFYCSAPAWSPSGETIAFIYCPLRKEMIWYAQHHLATVAVPAAGDAVAASTSAARVGGDGAITILLDGEI